MKNYTRKLTLSEINHLVNNLKGFEKENKNPNVLHSFLYNGVTISVYKTNVVLVQGQEVSEIVGLFLQPKGRVLTEKILDVNEIINMDYKALNPDVMTEIGCDEVGVGDYFGGLVVASALVKSDQIEFLKNSLITDSKLLNDKKIKEIFLFVEKKIKYSVIAISPKEYNELFQTYNNSHIIKTKLHNESVNNLLNKCDEKESEIRIIMDQYASQKNYEKYLDYINPKKRAKIDIFQTKAESKYISVALASIIARYHFLKQIDEIRNKTKLPIFLGASNPQIKVVAKRIFNKGGITELEKYVKIHFSITNQIIKSNNNKKTN